MSYIGKQPVVGNFQVCDDITVVNGQAAYTMQVSSANVEPENANHMLVSLNGVLQKPGSSFTISGATITFASNLATGDVIDFIILLGNVLDIGAPSDSSVTNAKLASDLISGETDIGGAIADADLFLLDDGAGGTLRKTAASRIKTYVGGGKVLQVVSAIKTSVQTVSSADFTDISGLSVDITPAATSSKILVLAHITLSSGNHGHTRCVRESTVIGAGVAASSRGAVSGYANSDGNSANVQPFVFLDSPSTTSEITYKFQLESNNSAASYINQTTNEISATFMQISKSSTFFLRAQNLIPGGVNSPVRAFKSVNMTPIFIQKGFLWCKIAKPDFR